VNPLIVVCGNEATGWMIGVHFLPEMEKGILLFTIVSRLALEPTQPPVQWVSGALSLRVKWLGCAADHLSQSMLRLRMHGTVRALPHMSSWNGD